MSEEQVIAETPAPAESAPDTTVTATDVESPVVGEVKPEAPEKPRTFTQEDVDKIVSKEKARVERKLQRDIDRKVEEALARSKPTTEEPAAPQKPKRDQFANDEEYVEAVATFKAQEIVKAERENFEKTSREQRQRQHQEQVHRTFAERQEAARDKYEDFDEVAYNPSVPITPAMAQVIQESEDGAEIAYFLGQNIKEADRIARMSPLLQARELGRIGDKLASAPPPAKPTSAPAPITPISRASGSPVVDTLDPKSLEKMGTTAWIEAERKRQIEKWKRAQG